MNIPVLPTDNLYKFGALGGVLLVVAGAVLIGSAVDRSAAVASDLSSAMELIDPATDGHLELLFEDLDRRMRAAMVARDAAPEDEKEALNEQVQGIFDEAFLVGWDRVRQTHAYDRYAAEMSGLNVRLKSATLSLTVAKGLVYLGIFIALASIVAWYFLHQRHQDSLLRHSLRKAALEVAAMEGKPQQKVSQDAT